MPHMFGPTFLRGPPRFLFEGSHFFSRPSRIEAKPFFVEGTHSNHKNKSPPMPRRVRAMFEPRPQKRRRNAEPRRCRRPSSWPTSAQASPTSGGPRRRGVAVEGCFGGPWGVWEMRKCSPRMLVNPGLSVGGRCPFLGEMHFGRGTPIYQ